MHIHSCDHGTCRSDDVDDLVRPPVLARARRPAELASLADKGRRCQR
ncbi:hypothetical protein LG3211_3367 [Lysobacter gummosus]|nr:hypothetical protein LG3211_3367 [Lysobacter gummosus]